MVQVPKILKSGISIYRGIELLLKLLNIRIPSDDNSYDCQEDGINYIDRQHLFFGSAEREQRAQVRQWQDFQNFLFTSFDVSFR